MVDMVDGEGMVIVGDSVEDVEETAADSVTVEEEAVVLLSGVCNFQR